MATVIQFLNNYVLVFTCNSDISLGVIELYSVGLFLSMFNRTLEAQSHN